jgi:hypothetical protein
METLFDHQTIIEAREASALLPNREEEEKDHNRRVDPRRRNRSID